MSHNFTQMEPSSAGCCFSTHPQVDSHRHRGMRFDIMSDFTGYSYKVFYPTGWNRWSKPFREIAAAIAEAKLIIDQYLHHTHIDLVVCQI